jgi:hypothetical protein
MSQLPMLLWLYHGAARTGPEDLGVGAKLKTSILILNIGIKINICNTYMKCYKYAFKNAYNGTYLTK